MKRISLSRSGQRSDCHLQGTVSGGTALGLLAVVDEQDTRRLIEALRPIVSETRLHRPGQLGNLKEHHEQSQEIPA